MELDVSCNEIQTVPSQIGNLDSLRDLNLRRNHLVHLPEELAELPLIRLDFSCNKITTIPVCYRNLRHLQTITLDNNPLQSPPAQICIKGKVHIFKYLNMEACKVAPDLPDYDRRPIGFGSCQEELYSSRPYGALDSGFNSVDSGDKRWSGNEPTDEFSDLPLRVAEITKEQRLRRESQYQEHRGNTVVTNGGVEHDLDQIDFIDSCVTEEEEEEVRQPKCMESDSLSSQFMAYIEQRRISHEGSPVKLVPIRECHRSEDTRRYLHHNKDVDELKRPESLSLTHDRERQQLLKSYLDRAERASSDSSCMLLLSTNHNQQKASQSPQKQSTLDSENGFEPVLVFENDSNTNTIKRRPGTLNQSDDRTTISPNSPASQTVHLSAPYPGPPAAATPPAYRNSPQRPESFLFRNAARDDTTKAVSSSPPASASSPASATTPAISSEDHCTNHSSKLREEEAELIEQLRKNIEARLKVSLPSDLGAALTDGVVLCHLANHVRPRSVPSIHVPSPAVPKLTMAKCRRNVENFLEACRKIGVPQDSLCSPSDILQLNLSIKRTVESLLSLGADSEEPNLVSLSTQLCGFAAFYCALMLMLCVFYRWVFFL
ncbi:DISP complex protein LRCH3 isoform X9 [Sceloporus undulatus]|uniref:DISP complex protein LRCH3 isoform X9 n=1 Tax=Sceloporus undulatus TaxID=8520 RepID=UPI001C4BCCD3|nr:DISP complex protein LRCH3 isoform X9 [Sceloporus undulatus]